MATNPVTVMTEHNPWSYLGAHDLTGIRKAFENGCDVLLKLDIADRTPSVGAVMQLKDAAHLARSYHRQIMVMFNYNSAYRHNPNEFSTTGKQNRSNPAEPPLNRLYVCFVADQIQAVSRIMKTENQKLNYRAFVGLGLDFEHYDSPQGMVRHYVTDFGGLVGMTFFDKIRHFFDHEFMFVATNLEWDVTGTTRPQPFYWEIVRRLGSHCVIFSQRFYRKWRETDQVSGYGTRMRSNCGTHYNRWASTTGCRMLGGPYLPYHEEIDEEVVEMILNFPNFWDGFWYNAGGRDSTEEDLMVALEEFMRRDQVYDYQQMIGDVGQSFFAISQWGEDVDGTNLGRMVRVDRATGRNTSTVRTMPPRHYGV